jgi:hypothetical protein
MNNGLAWRKVESSLETQCAFFCQGWIEGYLPVEIDLHPCHGERNVTGIGEMDRNGIVLHQGGSRRFPRLWSKARFKLNPESEVQSVVELGLFDAEFVEKIESDSFAADFCVLQKAQQIVQSEEGITERRRGEFDVSRVQKLLSSRYILVDALQRRPECLRRRVKVGKSGKRCVDASEEVSIAF